VEGELDLAMIERIRVAQLFYTFDVEVGGGGLTRFAIELGKHLDPQHFDISLISLGYFSSPLGHHRIAQLQNEGIRAYEATSWNENKPYESFFKATLALRREFLHRPVDILHSHSEYTDITALILKATGVTPHILRTVHYGFQYEWSTKPIRRALLTNLLYPLLFNLEIGINQANTDRLNRRWFARLFRRKALRVYNAIPVDRFTNTKIDVRNKKETLGLDPDAIVVGSAGRLAEQKGYIYLIEAIQLVLNMFPQAYFLIVGDGPLGEELKARVSDLDIASHVLFTGGRTDIEELLACMDLFVSSSLWEGLPTVLLESMASKVPVIGTDIPGTNELIQCGENGWLVPPRNSVELGKAIIRLIESKSLREGLAVKGYQTALEFSIEKIASQYESIYENLLLNL
jgi:glycosyltransferase involved in cell wall biosynthesis